MAAQAPLPRPEQVPLAKRAGVLDLLRIPGLRQTFWVSLLLATGWDLFTFLIPLYGARLGLPPPPSASSSPPSRSRR